MADKYSLHLEALPFDLLHIAQSFANDNKSPKIEPAHLFRALLHKSAGLVSFIEDTLDEDYYYLVDWCDVRMQQCDKSPYGMKGVELSRESQVVVKEALSYCENMGADSLKAEHILAALVSPGVAFSAEQLKTMPLKSEKILKIVSGDTTPNASTESTVTKTNTTNSVQTEYCIPMMQEVPTSDIIGFDLEIRTLIEVLARKDRANILVVGETGVGKSSLIWGLLKKAEEKKLPSSLANIEPYELDLISLSQGVSYKGEIEDRFKSVTESLLTRTQPILVIENFHRIEDKQSTLNGILPNLKKLLSKNQLQIICTTTVDGYTKDIEKDKELTAYFEKIAVEAPSEDVAVEILQSKCTSYVEFHNLPIEKDVLRQQSICLIARCLR